MPEAAVPAVTLANGARLPRIGLGTWPFSDAEAESVIPAAMALGYRLFDTAYSYHNESGVGRGLRAGAVAREELFVTSKFNGEWHGVEEAHEAFAASVERLGLDYLDLFLIHWPLPANDRFVDAWRGLLALREDGRVRAIGVSNFKPAHIERLLAETGVAPEVNQIELNPTIARAGPREYHARHGIVTQAWSPLGRDRTVLNAPVLGEIAARHAKTAAQIVLRWHMELGLTAVPRSADTARLAQNIDVFDFELSPAEVAAISALDRGESAATDSDVFGH